MFSIWVIFTPKLRSLCFEHVQQLAVLLNTSKDFVCNLLIGEYILDISHFASGTQASLCQKCLELTVLIEKMLIRPCKEQIGTNGTVTLIMLFHTLFQLISG